LVKVLLVDDEPLLLEVTSLFLTELGGCDVDAVPSVKDALNRMAGMKYEVIVSDYQMPEMDGIAFLKTIREMDDDTPFILFTGRGREDVVIDAINNGADFYLQKGGDARSQFAELLHHIEIAVKGKRTKESLDKRTEELENFFNITLDLLCIANTDSYFLELNPQWERTLGYTIKELKGVPFTNFIHPDDVRLTIQAVEDQIHKRSIINFTNRYRRKDGTYRYLEWRSRTSGKLIFAAARDITDRILEQERLLHLTRVLNAVRHVNQILFKEGDRHKLLQGVCHALVETQGFKDVWMAINDRTGRFQEVYGAGNGVCPNVLRERFSNGETPRCMVKAIERNSLVISDMGQKDCENCPHRQFSNGEIAMTHPIRYGSRMFGAITVSIPMGVPYTSEDVSLFEEIVGDLAYGLSHMEKNEDNELAEQALFETEALFAIAFYKSPVPMAFSRVSDGLYIEANDAFLRFLGYLKKELVGKTVLTLKIWMNQGDRRTVLDELNDKGSVRERKASLRTSSGQIREVVLSMDAVHYKGEKCLLTTITSMDQKS
jgi:PAS domain S-box-containing protein